MTRIGFRDRCSGIWTGIVSICQRGHTLEAERFSLHGQQLFQILTTTLLGTILSVIGWFAVVYWEDRANKLEFGARANNVKLTLEAGMNEHFNKIIALRALFSSSELGINRAEFETFSKELLRGTSAILSVSWIPRVKRDERFAHELAAERDGVAGYHIKSVTPDGRLATSPERDEYFPVYYTTEKQYSGSVLGLDLVDGGLREDTLKNARDINRLAASKVIVLQSGVGDRRGFFVLLPVYKQGLPHETVTERRENLVGFVQGVFQIATMIETILGPLRTPVDLHTFAPESGPNAFPLHIHSSSMRATPAELKPLGTLAAGSHWSGTLEVADLRWKLVAVLSPTGRNTSHASAWLLLIAGLLVTGVVGAFMWSSARYAINLLRANQLVSELAETDALTNLANRRAFLDRLADAFALGRRGAGPFALLYIDLDHFKDVNDTLGHPIGDALLRQAAQRLERIVRESDFVARFGGDEFAVLQTNAMDVAASGALATKIVASLGEPYIIDRNEVHITASVGISTCSAELDGSEAAMMEADLALYRAKEDGRNCFRFHNKELDERVRERVAIGDELRVAIARGELELHYQPQVEITSGQIVGLEALVRWNSPTRGLVAPSLFIPVAEKTGSIIALGKWVFEEACRQIKTWEDQGFAPRSIAVNLSAIQCRKSELERDIAEAIERWNIRPGRLEVELTESVLMEATQEHDNIVERLRTLGLTIAIDDFGTGYSSLNYLITYPVDRLKIAQELVFGVTTDSRHAAVVRTAIHLAQELRIAVIAEGVETAGQALFLVSAGCKYAQGYYFSRPVCAKQATELLRQKKIMPVNQSESTENLTAA